MARPRGAPVLALLAAFVEMSLTRGACAVKAESDLWQMFGGRWPCGSISVMTFQGLECHVGMLEKVLKPCSIIVH